MRNDVPTRLARRASKVQGRRPRSHGRPSSRDSQKNQPAAFVGMDKRHCPATKRPARRDDLTEFPILQFGASRFLRALGTPRPVRQRGAPARRGDAAASPSRGSSRGARKAAGASPPLQPGQPYPVLVKGLSHGAAVDERVEVTSVGDGRRRRDPMGRARAPVHRRALRRVQHRRSPATRPIPATGLRRLRTRSFPAKLAKLLLARHSRRRRPDHPLPLRADAPANGQGPAGRGPRRAR